MRLAVDNSPALIAWAAYDRAMLKLTAVDQQTRYSTPAERMRLAVETAQLWRAFTDAFAADQARPAA